MRAAPGEVFAALADHETWPEWFDSISKVERLGDHHDGVGSWRRVYIGSRISIDEEFIVWEPGKAWGFTVHESSHRLVESLNELVTIQETGPDRVRVTYTMGLQPTRATGVLLRLGAKRKIGRNLGAALENLADRLTEGAST